MTRVNEQRHTAERTGLLCDLHPQILDEGLDQQFNSLQAQREACEAVVNTQRHAGWVCLPACYDLGGFSDATMDRPRSATAARRYRRGAGRHRRRYKIDRLTNLTADKLLVYSRLPLGA